MQTVALGALTHNTALQQHVDVMLQGGLRAGQMHVISTEMEA